VAPYRRVLSSGRLGEASCRLTLQLSMSGAFPAERGHTLSVAAVPTRTQQYRTQESNLEWAGQSRRSCRLDESGMFALANMAFAI
jgi:hypothetical protein